MAIFRSARQKLGIVGELLAFMWRKKLWWMIPMLVVLLLIGLLVALSLTTPVAPFVYTLF
ncbi:MAG: hypothetical protein HY077_10090 [Elusimicrobia bacterium]|nr:hypothetical protein [Elusimicrobiota bacterium]